MKRKDFLKSSLTVALLGAVSPTSVFAQENRKKPLYTFLQLNDTHLDGPINSRGVYAWANARLKWFVEEMNREGGVRPLFILYLGDMIHQARQDIAKAMVELEREVLNKIPFMILPCLGNHENRQRQGCPVANEPYIKTFGQGRVDYVFKRGPLQFIVFDNSGMPPRPTIGMIEEHERLRVERLKWLEPILAADPSQPRFICSHIPLACVREEKILAKSFGFPSYYAHDAELLELLSRYNKSILGALSGHLHLTGVAMVDGIRHINISGLASYPHDYGIFDVYTDRVEVRIESAPEDMHQPYASNIHCSRRHGIDYTDAQHPTHELYVRGNPDERQFTIPMPTV
jgi:hypothetical protein